MKDMTFGSFCKKINSATQEVFYFEDCRKGLGVFLAECKDDTRAIVAIFMDGAVSFEAYEDGVSKVGLYDEECSPVNADGLPECWKAVFYEGPSLSAAIRHFGNTSLYENPKRPYKRLLRSSFT